MGIVQHRAADLDLGVGKPIGGVGIGSVEVACIWQRVVACPQSVIVRLGDFRHDGLAARVHPVLVDPEEVLIRHRVILGERDLVLRARQRMGRKAPLDLDPHGFRLRDEVGRPIRLRRKRREADGGRQNEAQNDWLHDVPPGPRGPRGLQDFPPTTWKNRLKFGGARRRLWGQRSDEATPFGQVLTGEPPVFRAFFAQRPQALRLSVNKPERAAR